METKLITCPHCHAKNRVPIEKSAAAAKCGRCHKSLAGEKETGRSGETVTLRCAKCHTKNRVPADKIHAGAKCGRCGAALPHKDLFSGRPVMVTDANFEQTVLSSPLPVLLYGWAPWCSVCSTTGPTVEELARETKGKIRVAKLNVDTNPKLASQYNILSVPSFFIFDGGQLKGHLPGAVPKHELMMKMASYI